MSSLVDYNHPDLLFPSRYVKAADLRGRDCVVVIDKIAPREELIMAGGVVEEKPVMYFRDKDKALVLNKTNCQIIASIYGSEITSWIGKPITLYHARVKFGTGEVDAIRVRPVRPTTVPGAAPAKDAIK